MTNQAEIIESAKKRGFLGVALLHQGGDTPYLAMCLGRDGEVCDPRNWNTHRTPEEALTDLHRILTELPPCLN